MLSDPRSQALVSNFAGQWLFLRELRNRNPDVLVYPDFDDNLRQAFQRETELLFDSVVHEDRSVFDLMNADYTFVNERLAKHYGIPNVYGSDFRRVPVPSEARRGLLGQGSILTVTSAPNRTSPVTRGAWILENLLGTPAAAAAAGRAGVSGEEDRPGRRRGSGVGARQDDPAPHESALPGLPPDHGSHRPGAGELRRRRPLAHGGIRASGSTPRASSSTARRSTAPRACARRC